MDARTTPPEAAPDTLSRLPYEATLTVMMPGQECPHLRAQRRRLLAARDIASRELGKREYTEELHWVICALLRVSGAYCYRKGPAEVVDLAVEFAVQQWHAITLLRRLEAFETHLESPPESTA